MSRPKVYKEYFPSCIERFFGGGRPRRIKARCFVPYSEEEKNTDIYLGPSPEAPNIDLNMTVRKQLPESSFCLPEMGPLADAEVQPQPRQQLECGCRCNCSETSGSSSSSSRYLSQHSQRMRAYKSQPKILLLEDDGRYRAIDCEELSSTFRPQRRFSKTKSIKEAKLIAKENSHSVEDSHISAEIHERNNFHEDTQSPENRTEEESSKSNEVHDSKKGVVLGYVMYDPKSKDKKPYVYTTDGKKILPST